MANPQQIIQIVREKPQILIGVGVALVGLILTLVLFNPFGGDGNNSDSPCGIKLDKSQLSLVSVPNVGRAIEVQALLARESIVVDRVDLDGGKAELRFRTGADVCQRDRALLSLVQSGLMDKNMGLEAFDKGDLTASREEKRIKLIRAQQGELARLIRKMDPVEDATVSLSIPEPSIFRANEHPMSASVQVTLANGVRLTNQQVRAIINLVVGSVQGLDVSHVALSDTNGSTYNSVLGNNNGLENKLEEQDQYMRQKVASQLDKLVGNGHYVVTVSTQLRQSTREVLMQAFDPNQSVVASKQQFSERLASESDTMETGGLTTTYVPRQMATVVDADGPEHQRSYNRSGEEVSYANTKTQTLETLGPGVVEDISIAVTIDEDHYPKTTGSDGNMKELNESSLKQLIANAASPKVRLNSVSLARINFGGGMAGSPVFGDDDTNASGADAANTNGDGTQWWVWVLWGLGGLAGLGILGALVTRISQSSGSNSEALSMQAAEIQRLQEMSRQQQEQLQATQQQTQQLMQQGPQALPLAAGQALNQNRGPAPAMAAVPAGNQQNLPNMDGLDLDNLPLGPTPGQGSGPGDNEAAAMDLQQTLDDLGTRIGTDADDAQVHEEIDNWMQTN